MSVAWSPALRPRASSAGSTASVSRYSPAWRISALLLVTCLGLTAGWEVTDLKACGMAVAQAGPDLTHLLRAMAAIKALAAALVIAVVVGRLAEPISPRRWLAYAGSCVAMAAGPGLIWQMVHVGWGAASLHGGLLAAVVLLCRDPAMSRLLEATIIRRRTGNRG